MSIKTCAVCTRPARKRQLVYARNGAGLRQCLVCSDCASSAITVVLGMTLKRCSCGDLATTCGTCARSLEIRSRVDILKAASAKIRNLVRAYNASPPPAGLWEANDRIDGLMQAAEIIEAGDF